MLGQCFSAQALGLLAAGHRQLLTAAPVAVHPEAVASADGMLRIRAEGLHPDTDSPDVPRHVAGPLPAGSDERDDRQHSGDDGVSHGEPPASRWQPPAGLAILGNHSALRAVSS